jgi:hypothetical protein
MCPGFTWFAVFAGLCAAGCGGWGDLGGDGGATDGGGAMGYGRPTLQVTLNGSTTGQVTPDSTSYADVVDQYDAVSGRLASSSLVVNISSAAVQAGCAVGFQVMGENVAPIGPGSYQVSATPPTQAIASVEPITDESVFGAGTSWHCAGSGCDGAVVQLLTVARDHVEGFFSGTLPRVDGASYDSLTCSFYVATRQFQR